MRLKKVSSCVCAALVILAFASSRADAAPIGFFTFDYANDFFLGPSQWFTVVNNSTDAGLAGDFGDVVLQLTGTDLVGNPLTMTIDYAATAFGDGFEDASLGNPFGTISASSGASTLFALDLSSISLDSAILSLAFTPTGSAPPGTVQIGSFSASDFANLLDGTEITKPIEYVPTSVPEPGTLLLLGCGLAVGAGRKYSQVRSRRR